MAVPDPPAGPWRPTSKAKLAKYQSQSKRGVALKPFTVLAEEAIPPVPEVENARSGRHGWLSFSAGPGEHARAQSAGAGGGEAGAQDRQLRFYNTGPLPQRDKTLDGFLMLEASSAALPHQATRVTINDDNLTETVAEDLAFFTNLMFVDLGDNRLSLESLAALPAVVELRLHCNGVREVGELPSGCFPRLEVLDLSYNALTAPGIDALAQLPNLRELDLTCNALEALPRSMAGFKRLEVLILERNRLEADAEFLSLAKAPRLRELNMSFNYFKAVPAAAGHPMAFRMLEWLNLANNYIASERDVLPLVKFPRLLQVILYGNPITDSKTRRDEVDSSAKQAGNAELDAEEVEGRIVNLVTDVPVPNAGAKGAYNTFRITKVVERGGPSATQWREAGNRALFGDDSDYDEEEEAAALAASKKQKQKKKKKKKKKDRPAREDERTNLFITATGDDGVSVDSSESETESDEEEGLSVPAMLLQRSLQGPGGPNAQGDPARLRAAINALRHALKHPLTSHAAKSSKSAAERPTKLQKMRQKPIKPYSFVRSKVQGGGGRVAGLNVARHHLRGLETGGPITRTTFVGADGAGAGAGAPASVASSRAAFDDAGNAETLEKMEDMLERMDTRMRDVENELGAAAHHDKSMGLLMDMVGKVMETYD